MSGCRLLGAHLHSGVRRAHRLDSLVEERGPLEDPLLLEVVGPAGVTAGAPGAGVHGGGDEGGVLPHLDVGTEGDAEVLLFWIVCEDFATPTQFHLRESLERNTE